MKNLITALAVSTLIAAPSFAATKTVRTTTTTTTTAPAIEPVRSSPAYSSRSSSAGEPIFSASFGLGTLLEKFHFGVGLKAQFPVDLQGNDFKFGLRTGFYVGPSSPSTWVLPILATGEYDFRTSNPLKPYFGLEMGISIGHVSTGLGMSGSSTDFGLLFVPGINFGDNQMYFFEVPIGTLNQSLALFPSVGMHF